MAYFLDPVSEYCRSWSYILLTASMPRFFVDCFKSISLPELYTTVSSGMLSVHDGLSISEIVGIYLGKHKTTAHAHSGTHLFVGTVFLVGSCQD
jgi:hypothetical protein